MFNLIKYDWKQKWIYVTGILILIFLMNAGVYIREIDPEIKIAKLLSYNIFAGMGLVLVLFIVHIRKMQKLLFSEEGQFTFLTPLNGYEILGSKIIGSIIDVTLLLVLFGSIIIVNLNLNEHQFIDESLEFLKVTGVDFYKYIPNMILYIFISYTLTLVTIYLSMILVKTLFYNIKFKKILSFIVFLVVSKGNTLYFELVNNFSYDSIDKLGFDMIALSLVQMSIILLVWYGLSSYLLEKRVSA